MAELILTNDDGLDAPGLQALYEATEHVGKRSVIAPVDPWSSRSHAVTTDRALRILVHDDGRVGVAGTPADCVRLGLHHLAPGAQWVLSGINAGGNLGADIYHSGTVAAAREAVLHGRPAVALSHYWARGRPIDWPQAARWAARVLTLLLAQPWEPGTFWNVNLPHPEPGSPDPPIIECPLDPSPLPLRFHIEGDSARYTGDYQTRARQPGCDVDLCFRGHITLTCVPLFVGLPAQEP